MVVNDDEYLLVDFEKFCDKCIHNKKKENEQPCCECLEHATNLHSHKPVRFEKK